MARKRKSAWAQSLGQAAESLAARHLQARGCVVLAQRYRCARGEVDLVVRDGDVLVFVEVKARKGTAFGAPILAVDWRKRRRIIATARHYLRNEGPSKCECRFDVVSVCVGKGRAEVDWIRDAFRR